MAAPVSIVIPTWHAAGVLPETLACLMEGVATGLVHDLVISDGGSEDGTAEIAAEAGAGFVAGPPGRGGQLRRGAAAASAPWLLFVHADTHLSPGWSARAARHIAEDPDRAAYFRLRFRSAGPAPAVVAFWANFRSRAFGLPYGDQGLLISRALYDAVGGYPDIVLMEDVALARALSGRLTPLSAEARTSAARYQKNGWVGQGAQNLWRLTRYLAGADPAKLARSYGKV
ncbi:MAG: TIGR04283 family arsenosugar biosynthesis glycosyltransferase [Pseudomonadota bacterium]